MEQLRKTLIIALFVGIGFIATVLRVWDRREPFVKEVKTTLIILLILGAIAAVFIYVNN